MKYQFKSFSIPPAVLHNGVNMHGQSWEDIFGSGAGDDGERRVAMLTFSQPVVKQLAEELVTTSPSSSPGQLPKETD